MNKDSKSFVAGHRGMVGSALLRRLEAGGYTNVVTRNRLQLELLDQRSASEFIELQRPEVVFFALGVAAAAEALLRAMDWQVPLHFAPDKAAGARDRGPDLGRITSLGWQAATALEEGLAASYAAFVEAGAGK